MTRTYRDLIRIPTFAERLEYLRLSEQIGSDTFGINRYLNQQFYRSNEWRRLRREVIIRDNGCDLGIQELPIVGRIYIHHLNPLEEDDIVNCSESLLNPENLICCSFETHNAIHFGTDVGAQTVTERKPNDTCPWRE